MAKDKNETKSIEDVKTMLLDARQAVWSEKNRTNSDRAREELDRCDRLLSDAMSALTSASFYAASDGDQRYSDGRTLDRKSAHELYR